MKENGKPKVNSQGQSELDRAQEQFDAYDKNIKDLTLDRMNAAPLQETESNVKLSSREMARSNEIHLKPKRIVGPGVDPKTGKREQFNEKFRKQYEFLKEEVCFVAEHKEIIGEGINDMWTKPFGGMNAESWDIPAGVPVWGPRYVAEQIKKSRYHRLRSEDRKVTGIDGMGTYTGSIVVDTTVQRLDAHPVDTRKSIFMSSEF